MDLNALHKEVDFKAVRSGGPGGQHANKVATKVELYWHVPSTEALSDTERERVLFRLMDLLNKEQYLIVTDASSRSQANNREAAFLKLVALVEEALYVPKPRKKTKPGKKAKEKRLKDKKIRSEKKTRRQKPEQD